MTPAEIGLAIVVFKMIVAAVIYVVWNRFQINALKDKIEELDSMKSCLGEIKTLLARIDERLKTLERANSNK